MAATLSPTEDQVFDAVWEWVNNLFNPALPAPQVLEVQKGFQNNTATPTGSYIVVSPGVKVRQDQIRRDYDPLTGKVRNTRNTTYTYQVDCYNQGGPDNADVVSIAWRTMLACDTLVGKPITPLYADEPVQLNIVNSENLYEQRFMVKLYAQVNQVVTQTQDFFVGPVPVVVEAPPADLLPV